MMERGWLLAKPGGKKSVRVVYHRCDQSFVLGLHVVNVFIFKKSVIDVFFFLYFD